MAVHIWANVKLETITPIYWGYLIMSFFGSDEAFQDDWEAVESMQPFDLLGEIEQEDPEESRIKHPMKDWNRRHYLRDAKTRSWKDYRRTQHKEVSHV